MSRFIAVFMVSVAATRVAEADILNPGFEETPVGLYVTGQNIGGWHVDNGDVEVVDLWQAARGNQSLDLNGNSPGSVSQEGPTSAGALYILRFAMAGNPAGAPTIKIMQVGWLSGYSSFSDVISFDTTGRTLQDMGWVYHEYIVQAGGETATVSFGSLVGGCYGPALDDVSLVPTPLGDLNCDGVVNFADIDPFVLAITSRPLYEAQYPDCYWLNGDCNADGWVDFRDIDPFVALLSGG